MKTLRTYNVYIPGAAPSYELGQVSDVIKEGADIADRVVGFFKGLFGGGTTTWGCCDFCTGVKLGNTRSGTPCHTKFPNTYDCGKFNNDNYLTDRLLTGKNHPCNAIERTGQGTAIVSVRGKGGQTRTLEVPESILQGVSSTVNQTGGFPSGVSTTSPFGQPIPWEKVALYGGGGLLLLLALTSKRRR